MQHKHGEPLALARFGVLQRLPVSSRVAECGEGPTANHEVDPFGLPALLSFRSSFGSLVRKGLPLLSQFRFINITPHDPLLTVSLLASSSPVTWRVIAKD
jgi:hypothetical protein